MAKHRAPQPPPFARTRRTLAAVVAVVLITWTCLR